MQAGCGALGTQRHLGALFRKRPIVAFNCNEQLCSTSYLKRACCSLGALSVSAEILKGVIM